MKKNLLFSFLLVIGLLFLNGCGLLKSTTTEIPSQVTSLVTTTPLTIATSSSTTLTSKTETELTVQLRAIYQLAVDSESFDGTYEEWLESVRGPQGVPGEDARNLELNVDGFVIQWRYTTDTEWTYLFDLSVLQGQDGKDVSFRIYEDNLQWQYAGEDSWRDLLALSLMNGTDGVGISSMAINTLGELIIQFTDGTSSNLGTLLKVFLVQFVGMNGNLIYSQLVGYGLNAENVEAPQVEGFTFAHWSASTANITENLTVYAEYTRNQYTVVFDSQGGNACDSITQVPYASTVTLPIPIKEGYVFLGWFFGSEVTNKPFYSEDEITSDLTLYAHWAKAQCLVRFVDDDDTILYQTIVSYGMDVIQPTSPSREGYDFVGWDHSTKAITEDCIIKAVYSIKRFTISFISDGIDISPLTQVSYGSSPELPVPTMENEVFLGWLLNGEPYNENTLITGNVELEASWTELVFYSIFFESDNYGYHIDPWTVACFSTIDSLPILDKEGYDFVGWSFDGVLLSTPFIYDFNIDLILWPSWTIRTTTISFDSQGGSAVSSISGEYDTPVSIPESPVKPGFVFAGWYLDQELTIYYEFGNMPSNDITLYADWGTEGLAFELNENGYSVSVGEAAVPGSIRIPIRYLGIPVVKIADYGFYGLVISNLILHEGLNEIGNYAFADEEFLHSSDSIPILTDICTIFTTCETNPEDYIPLKDYVLPSSVEKIGDHAFEYNPIESITFINGSQLVSIGDYAFYHAANLESVLIPSMVETIGSYAFMGDGKLLTLSFEEGSCLQTIGAYAFANPQSSILEVSIDLSPYDVIIDIEELIIPASVVTIGDYAFSNLFNLTSLSFEEGSVLQSIGNGAFQNCVLLTTLNLPENLKTIGDAAFMNCSEVTSIIWPNALQSIGEYAFFNMNHFSEIVVPDSVIMIKKGAFGQWNSLVTISVPFVGKSRDAEGVEALFGYIFGNQCAINTSCDIADYSLQHVSRTEGAMYVIPLSLRNIRITDAYQVPDGAFSYLLYVTDISFSNSLISIGNYAFCASSSLVSISFGDNSSLKTIGDYAFASQRALVVINMDDLDTTSLSSIVIPKSVEQIGSYAFYYSGIQTVIFEEGGQLTNIAEYMFCQANQLISVVIPEGVTTIEDYAFYNIASSFSIQFPSSLVSIGQNAFFNAGLLSVTFAEDGNLSIIGPYAFYRARELTTLVIPNYVTEIQNYAFAWISTLETLEFEDSSSLSIIGDYAFTYDVLMGMVSLPHSLTFIGYNAFLATGTQPLLYDAMNITLFNSESSWNPNHRPNQLAE